MLRCSATRAMTRTLHEPWPKHKRPPSARDPPSQSAAPQKTAESISRKPYETSKHRVSLGSRGQGVHVGNVGHSVDHGQGLIELGKAHLTLDRGHAILPTLLRPLQRGDGALEQE